MAGTGANNYSYEEMIDLNEMINNLLDLGAYIEDADATELDRRVRKDDFPDDSLIRIDDYADKFGTHLAADPPGDTADYFASLLKRLAEHAARPVCCPIDDGDLCVCLGDPNRVQNMLSAICDEEIRQLDTMAQDLDT